MNESGLWQQIADAMKTSIDAWQLKRLGRHEPFQDWNKFKTDNNKLFIHTQGNTLVILYFKL